MDERTKMHSTELYNPNDPTIAEEQQQCLELLYDYNATRPHESEKRQALLKKMFAEIGDGCYIEPPLHANWAGNFVHLGKSVYANFNLTLVDDTRIDIGDQCNHCHCRSPDIAAAAVAGISIQRCGFCRQKLLDRRGRHPFARCYDRRQHSHRRGKRRDQGHSRQCHRGRKSVPRAA